MEYGAQTGFGGLRKVLMHRPTEELKRMTPVNKDTCLFRDVVYPGGVPEGARRLHGCPKGGLESRILKAT